MAKEKVLPSVFASVAFIKVHDFARRPVVEQARLRAQLEAVVAVTLPALAVRSRIVLDAADGVALVVLDDPSAALAIAERTLAAGVAGLPLAIGINHGPVRQTGKGKHEGLAGDGIAVAAAIAELAGPGKLLVTRDFRQALEGAAPGAEAGLAKAGTHTDSSLRAHEIFRHDPRGAQRRSQVYLAATVLAVLALAGGGIGYRASVEGPQQFASRMAEAVKTAAARLRAEPEAPPAAAAKRKGR